MNEAERKRNVFIVGLDPLNRQYLDTVDCADCVFHGLLNYEEIGRRDEYEFPKLLSDARSQLDAFGRSVDAIFTHWDFPMSVLVPILCRERDLRSPSLESLLQCADKYWSRLVQRRAIPDLIPRFTSVDPFQPNTIESIGIDPPFWLKPVAAFSSQLGFRIEGDADLQEALQQMREGIDRIGDPFDDVLKFADLPEEVERVGGRHCIAEEYITGFELAHEGAVFDGETMIHLTLDMVREDEVFTRLEMPSTAPSEVLERMEDATGRLLDHIGFDQGCFNAEYFWDPDTDRLVLIEVNPRISQSHSFMLSQVDGRSNHQVAVDVALGRKPDLPSGAGPFKRTAKFAYVQREDGYVERVPGEADLERAHEIAPEAVIRIVAKQGTRLSDLANQDEYSYDLAEMYLAADSQEELLQKYDAVVEALDFHIKPV